MLFVLGETARAQLERFANGLASTPLRRTVQPGEGELFLRTLRETFQNSTSWRVVDHSAAL